MCYTMFSSMPGLYPLDVSSRPLVVIHVGQNCPLLRITVLDELSHGFLLKALLKMTVVGNTVSSCPFL